MSTGHDDPQTDHAWDNRRLILASLAPPASSPPDRGASAAAVDDGSSEPAAPGPFTRGLHESGDAARAAGRQFNKRVPPNRRIHTAVITAAVVAVLVVVLVGVGYLTSDTTRHTTTSTTAAAPSPPTRQTPPTRDTILKAAHAGDLCPRDANYSDANLAFDGDLNTAWVCTRAKNQDGQVDLASFFMQGVCKDNADLMFSRSPSGIERARAVCAECPVLMQCRRYGTTTGRHEAGIWGGLTEAEHRGRATAPVAGGHGTWRHDDAADEAAA
jgi:hypothetical protein